MSNKPRDSRDFRLDTETKRLMHCTLIQQSPDGIVLHDGRSFQYMNQSARRIIGMNATADPRHYALWDFVVDSDKGSVTKLVRTSMKHLYSSFRTNIHILNLQGNIIHVEMIGTSVMINGDCMLQAILRDVTRKNLLKENLEKDQELIHSLIEHLADRTLNPLMVISGFLKLLREGHDNVDISILLEETEAMQQVWAQIIAISQEGDWASALENHLLEVNREALEE